MNHRSSGLATVLTAIMGVTLIFEHQALGCTSVCLAKQGRVVFGNNLDWFIDDGMVVINKRNVRKRGTWGDKPPEWVSKYASITTDEQGVGFADRGMNEAGLVVGEMWLGSTSYPERDSRYSVGTSQWMQYQLDMCATVEEVLATDKILRIDKDEYKSHFLICDASGACASVEWLNGKLCVHTGETMKVKALVNSPYADCAAHGDGPSGRFTKAAQMLDSYAGEDPVKYVFSTLRATRQDSTCWSLVFDVNNRRLYYSTTRNPEIRSVCLRDFELSCDSPVQMLNINAPGSGDVHSQFADFTYEENANITRASLDKWGQRYGKVSPTDTDKILNYHSTMRCETNLPAATSKMDSKGGQKRGK